MKQITAFTEDANQELKIVLDDGSVVQMTLSYVPSQLGWFYTLTYGAWSSELMRIVNSPNMLRKYRNVIPFGLCCTVIDGYEVINLSDFVSGRVSLYQLNSTDVAQTETLITKTLPTVAGAFIA